MDEGERYLEQALSHFEETQHRKPETRGAGSYFNVYRAGGCIEPLPI